MKTAFTGICIFLLSFATVKAQNAEIVLPIDPDTRLITYKEVVNVPGTPAELFNRAIESINKLYKNPADATKVRNPATGLIEIIHRFEITKEDKGVTLIAGIIDYSMKIELKDGRYRYTITNFCIRDASRQPIEKWLDKTDKLYQPIWESYLKQVDDAARKLIEGLKAGMLPPVPKKVDEW
jgi:hypothetical protein